MNIKSSSAAKASDQGEPPRPPETLPVEPVVVEGDDAEDDAEDNEFYTPDSDDQPKIFSGFSSSTDTVAIDSIQLTATVTEEHPLTTTGDEKEEEEEQYPNSTQQSQVSVEETASDLNLNSQQYLSNQRQLTPELIMRAEKEVNEKDSWRLRDIEALRDMLLGEFRIKTSDFKQLNNRSFLSENQVNLH